MPVPMHMDTTPYRWPVRRIWWSSVATWLGLGLGLGLGLAFELGLGRARAKG